MSGPNPSCIKYASGARAGAAAVFSVVIVLSPSNSKSVCVRARQSILSSSVYAQEAVKRYHPVTARTIRLIAAAGQGRVTVGELARQLIGFVGAVALQEIAVAQLFVDRQALVV